MGTSIVLWQNFDQYADEDNVKNPPNLNAMSFILFRKA